MTSFDEAWARADRIEGWLTEDQALLLYSAAAYADPGETIVEIGSHHGRATVILALAKAAGVRLLAIDPFDDPRWGGGQGALATFQASTTGLDVELHRGTSADAPATGPVAAVFIDGAHDRDSVLADIDTWEPRVRKGGRVLIHDAFSSHGVTRAVLRRHLLSRRYPLNYHAGSLLQFERRDVPTLDAIISALRLVGRLPWFARNTVVKLAMRYRIQWLPRALGHNGPGYPY